MSLKPRLSSILLALIASVVLAGCVNAAGASLSVSAVIFMIALLGLGIAACTDDTQSNNNGWQVGEDAGGDTSDTSDVSDASDARDADVEGHWQSCCEDGEVSTCFCPANMACNYGMYADCGDGTCSYDPNQCEAPVDAGDTGDADRPDADRPDAAQPDADQPDADAADTGPDADGTWQTCCKDGVVDTCFCPSGMACNYGWYTDCGDGTCVDARDSCDEQDAGM